MDSTDALSRYIYIYIYMAYVHRYCACAALRANVAGQIGKRFSPAESAFLVPRHNAMMMIDFKREGDALFRHLQGS